jgi:hypothetical protein
MLPIPGHANHLFGDGRVSVARMKTKRPRARRGRLQCRPVLMELETRRLLSLTALASFNGTNGKGPMAGLIMDTNGNLYGTTPSGGAAKWPFVIPGDFQIVMALG